MGAIFRIPVTVYITQILHNCHLQASSVKVINNLKTHVFVIFSEYLFQAVSLMPTGLIGGKPFPVIITMNSVI